MIQPFIWTSNLDDSWLRLRLLQNLKLFPKVTNESYLNLIFQIISEESPQSVLEKLNQQTLYHEYQILKIWNENYILLVCRILDNNDESYLNKNDIER